MSTLHIVFAIAAPGEICILDFYWSMYAFAAALVLAGLGFVLIKQKARSGAEPIQSTPFCYLITGVSVVRL